MTKLDRSQIGLPSAEKNMVADGREEDAYLDYLTLSNLWLYDYPEAEGYTDAEGPVYGYWTSTPYAAVSDNAWYVGCDGRVFKDYVDIGGVGGAPSYNSFNLSTF